MMRSNSGTCFATSIDQTISGFPLSGRTFLPGTDLLPPRAGITAIIRFPFSKTKAPAWSFDVPARADPTQSVERLAVLAPFSEVDPGVFTDRKYANTPIGAFDLRD